MNIVQFWPLAAVVGALACTSTVVLGVPIVLLYGGGYRRRREVPTVKYRLKGVVYEKPEGKQMPVRFGLSMERAYVRPYG